jgi:nickel/cobalt transporter (NicO) family protein
MFKRIKLHYVKISLDYVVNMFNETLILLLTAASIGFVHTITGPDHYIPFIALASARKWNKFKTNLIVILCGIGHVLSSVVIGLLGIALGIAITQITDIESARGDIAAWLLIGLGLAYTVWGIRYSYKNKTHSHTHFHDDSLHEHVHSHEGNHSHVYLDKKMIITPWVLFIIFIFGPCEPLIPLVMYPAAKENYFMMGLVTLVFGIVTILTMLGMVTLGLYGYKFFKFEKLEKHIHIISGGTILICGLAIKFLGL